MSKTLRYLPEGKDFGGDAFDNKHVFTPSGHRPEVFSGAKGYAKGGTVTTTPVETNRQLNPSTDPTSAKAKADNTAEANWRKSGGYGFKKGGKVNKGDRNAGLMRAAQAAKAGRGPLKLAEGGSVNKKIGTKIGPKAPSITDRLFGTLKKIHPLTGAMDKINDALTGNKSSSGTKFGRADTGKAFKKGGRVKKYAIGGQITPMQPGALAMARPAAMERPLPMDRPSPMAAPTPLNPQTFGGTGTRDLGRLPGAQPGPGMPTQTQLPPAVQTAGQNLGNMAGKVIAKRLMGGKGGNNVFKGFAKGGKVGGEKTMVRKGVHQHERAMHKGKSVTPLKFNAGGGVAMGLGGLGGGGVDPNQVLQNMTTMGANTTMGGNGMQPITTLKRGGKVKR